MDEFRCRPTAKVIAANPIVTASKPPALPSVPTPKVGTADKGKPSTAKTDPHKVRRRLIWTAVWAYLTANFLMFLRFFFPRALFEPSTIHTIGYPTGFQLGVNEDFKQAYRTWVVKEPD
jgi:hypothetical protein